MQIAALAVLGLVLIIAGFILQFVLPDIQYVGWGIIALGVVLSTSSAIIENRRVRNALVSHRGKYSASTTILVSTFLGIILLVNAAGANVYKTFDLTGISQFTITQQTKDVLENLNTPIDVLCFFVPKAKNIDESMTDVYSSARLYAPALLSEYTNYTHLLNIKVYDPEQFPEIARQYGLASEYYYQSVIFETTLGKKFVSAAQIYAEGENAFTSAIMQVTGAKQNKVYFLTGHGEAGSIDSSETGYSDARKELRNNLMEVTTLDLLAVDKVPEDCTVLVIAGPKNAFNDSERQKIEDYLDKAGRAIFLTNPGAPKDIAEIGALWGFDVKSGTIIDPDSYAAPNINT
ncbi:MAG: GldG family protein, partial [Dehalococcoidales bacterium]|nr:GldG family protein [Dehalococcoidales bacterium]